MAGLRACLRSSCSCSAPQAGSGAAVSRITLPHLCARGAPRARVGGESAPRAPWCAWVWRGCRGAAVTGRPVGRGGARTLGGRVRRGSKKCRISRALGAREKWRARVSVGGRDDDGGMRQSRKHAFAHHKVCQKLQQELRSRPGGSGPITRRKLRQKVEGSSADVDAASGMGQPGRRVPGGGGGGGRTW